MGKKPSLPAHLEAGRLRAGGLPQASRRACVQGTGTSPVARQEPQDPPAAAGALAPSPPPARPRNFPTLSVFSREIMGGGDSDRGDPQATTGGRGGSAQRPGGPRCCGRQWGVGGVGPCPPALGRLSFPSTCRERPHMPRLLRPDWVTGIGGPGRSGDVTRKPSPSSSVTAVTPTAPALHAPTRTSRAGQRRLPSWRLKGPEAFTETRGEAPGKPHAGGFTRAHSLLQSHRLGVRDGGHGKPTWCYVRRGEACVREGP